MTKRRRGSRGGGDRGRATARREWIGGRLPAPFRIHDRDEPYRAEMALWMEAPSGLVVGYDVLVPGEADGALGRALLVAMESPLAGPPRRPDEIRVADAAQAAQVRATVGETIPVAVAPTPELDVVLQAMAESMAGASAGEGFAGVGRNDPCPCGSGKKYKRCCAVAPTDLVARAARRVRDVQDEIEPRVMRLVRDRLGPGAGDRIWEEFACGYDVERGGPEMQLFLPWLQYGWIPDAPGKGRRHDTRTAAQLYLEAHRGRLSGAAVEFLEATCGAPMSFFDVLEVERGRRIRLRDILLGDEHEVFEQSGSEAIRVGDVFYARVVPYDGVALMIGSGAVVLPPIEKKAVLDLRKRLERDFGRPTAATLLAEEETLRRLYLGLQDKLMHPAPLVMQNTDGELLEFHTITCEVESAAAAFDALASLAKGVPKQELIEHAAFDAGGVLQKVEFAWTKAGNRKHPSWENTVLGQITIEGTTLRAEVNSAGRARRLQRMLRRRLGPAARKLTVAIRPLDEAMAEYEQVKDTPEEHRRQREAKESESSPEVQEALREMMARHWEGWTDERLPALDGRTPREAVREPDGREMVEALLMQFERGEAGRPGGGYDFDRLRRKLGLRPRERAPNAEF